MRGRCGDFPCFLLPYVHNFYHVNIPHQSETFVTIAKPPLAHCNHPKPIVYTRVHYWCCMLHEFGKCRMTCIHHYIIIQSIFTSLKISLLHLSESPFPGIHWSFYCLYDFVFSRMSHSWSHLLQVSRLFKLVYFVINMHLNFLYCTTECSNYCTIVLISRASKVILNILQARLQQHVSWELPHVQTGFQSVRGTEIKLPTFTVSWRKQGSSRKSFYFCFIDSAEVFDCVDHNKLWKILQEMGAPNLLTCLLRDLYVGQEATELDMEQFTGSKLGKKYYKAVYCYPIYLTYMQSMSCEMLDWITGWNQDCREKYQQPQICRRYHSNDRKWRGTKEPLDEREESEKEKTAWNSALKKLRSWHLVPSLHGKKKGKKWKQWQPLLCGAPKSLQKVTAATKLKTLAPWKESHDKPRQLIKKQRHHFADKGSYSKKLWFFL